MSTVKAKGIRAARAGASAGDVIVSFRTEVKEYHFAMSQLDVPKLLAQLIAAQVQASEQKAAPLPLAVTAVASTVAVDEQGRTVTVSMMPHESLHVPFSIGPAHARKLAAGLMDAAAILDPSGGGNGSPVKH